MTNNYRHAHILGLASLATISFGLAIGTEIRTTAIMAGLLAFAAVATVAYEKRLLARPAAAAESAPARRDSMVTTKRMLMLLMVVGVVAYAGGAGTFSSFSAETSNRNSSIASGTLAMSDTVNTGSACLSSNAASADNYQTACDVALTLTNQAPGVFGGASKITVANTGSIDASQLTVYAPYVNATLATQINSGTTIGSLATTALEGNVSTGDTIELDYGGQSIQMVASGAVSPTKTSIAVAAPGSQSCTLTSGSATVSCPSVTNLRSGMSVSAAAGIPAGTTILAVNTGLSQLTLSSNATAAGAQSLTFAVKATINFPVGTRVYDTSSNVSPTTTDCFDQIQQAALPANQPNFNGTDIGDGTHWDSTDNYCRTLLFWVQEQSNPTPAQSATTTSGSNSVTVTNGALLSQSLSPTVTLGVSGANIAANTTVTGVSGNTITLSQNATGSGSTTLAFTANNCWVGPGSAAAATNMCYAPIGANFPGSGTTTITSATSSITFASALQGNIKNGDTITISEPTKKIVTCIATQDAYIGATTITVNNTTTPCTSTASGWVGGTGETFDGATAVAPATPATIVDSTMNNLLNSDTTDTISNFDTAHNFSNKLELPPLTANGAHVTSGGGMSNIELAKKGSTGDTRSFYVGVFFPAGTGSAQNATQGLTSTFGLSWKIQQ